MDIAETKERLTSKLSKNRRRAAKEIGKSKLYELSDLLYQAYLKEINDKRTWETQSAMIEALGVLRHLPSIPVIESIVKINLPRDHITSEAAKALIRLTRISEEDASGILLLLEKGSYSVIAGALEAVALDKMHPSIKEIQVLLKKTWDINKHKDRINHEYGLTDPRIYVALACWDWDRSKTTPFLDHCIDTAYNISSFEKLNENTSLIKVCTNSLSGKISKGYLSGTTA